MRTLDAIRVALRSLAVNKLRTALTLLGMVIGVAAVITLMGLGAGVQASVEEQIRTTGTNLLFITPGSEEQARGQIKDLGSNTPTLTLEDSEAISSLNLPEITGVSTSQTAWSSLIGPTGSAIKTQVLGVTESYFDVRSYSVTAGREFSPQEMRAASRQIALGSSIAKQLFPTGNALGQKVRLNSHPFTVIAIMEETGTSGWQNRDNSALVPIKTMQTRIRPNQTIRGGNLVDAITVRIVDENEITIAKVKDDIGALLRGRHRVENNDFDILAQQEFIEAIGEVTKTISIFLGAVAGISLLVGGIGIMNIMLVAVTERTREIGIRKAIGARRRDILWQFMIESITVSIGGGLLGVGLGALGTFAGSGIGSGETSGQGGSPFSSLSLQLTIEPVLLALGISASIGLIFGIYPAARASRLNPIEALRHE